ncbi:MAG: hypothetical protein A2Y40_10725 [Candidatus Margulisbacteria bacterium GWF2_35_9]|nr:MAG: hypothetical protein A2Y40_10725 [Candidatus Margulisbacteria bacterium GWF2_35_9]
MIHLFLLVLIAHVLGDFVFQTNHIYRLKTAHISGVILHSAIFYLLALVLTFPVSYYNIGFSIWLFLVFVSHIFVDKIKMMFGKTIIRREFINFIIDQFIHVAIIASVFFIPIQIQQHIGIINMLKLSNISIYNINLGMFLASMMVFVTYAVSVLLYYYDSSIRMEQRPLQYNYNRMLYRGVLFFLLVGKYYPVGIVLIIANFIYSKKVLEYDMRRFIIEKSYLILLVIIYLIIKGVLI